MNDLRALREMLRNASIMFSEDDGDGRHRIVVQGKIDKIVFSFDEHNNLYNL